MADNPQPSYYRLGIFIFLMLAFLTGVEYAISLLLNVWQLLAFVALIKAGLVVYYYMHIYRLFAQEPEVDRESYTYKLMTNRIGLWLFFISDLFIFGGLILSRINLLKLTRPDLNQVVGLTVTGILLLSSFFANRAEIAVGRGDRKQFLASIGITMVLGILFLAGVLGVEWRIAPFGPGDGVQGAVFYSMTGFHAFHVFTGVVFLFIVLRNGLRNRYSSEKHWGVEACVVYWHFVDVVWVFLFPALYLIGTAI
jgi:cytochrome c oxidase subunit III